MQESVNAGGDHVRDFVGGSGGSDGGSIGRVGHRDQEHLVPSRSVIDPQESSVRELAQAVDELVAGRHPAIAAGDVIVKVVDLAEYELLLLDEPVPAIFGEYRNAHTRRWVAAIGSFEGFVSYGVQGGTPAVGAPALALAEAKAADVRSQVVLSVFSDFDFTGLDLTDPTAAGVLSPGEHQEPTLACQHHRSSSWGSGLVELALSKLECQPASRGEETTLLDDRKLGVLRAIVEDYVSTQEPVGSKSLVERHHLGVSPATVRNEMAALEEDGYITQPHTSAGRIPTDKGYRLFVDKLTGIKPLSSAEKRAIATFLQGAVDLDDVVHRSVRLLAQLTQQVAIVQYPTLARSTVRHVEVVVLSASRLLLVLITSAGRVEQRVVELPKGIDVEVIGELRARLNTAAVGQRLSDAAARVASLPEAFHPDDKAVVTQIIAVFAEAVADERTDEKVAIGGTSNLVRFGEDFDRSIKPLLEALEEHVVLLKLLGEATSPSLVTVRIGHEVPYERLATTSVVATGYGPSDDPLATLGVVGPTRMDYPGSMAAVHAVARYVSQLLSDA